MSRSRVLFVVVSLVVVVPVLSATLFGSSIRRDGDDSIFKFIAVFSEVLGLVQRAYVEEVDTAALLDGALDGSAEALDPLSHYVPAEQLGALDRVERIGLDRSGLLVLKERGVVYAASVLEGSPAASAGIEPGDIINTVDGTSGRQLPLWRLQELLVGEPGTRLELDILRRGEPLEPTLELADWERPAPTLRDVDGVEVLRLPSLTEETPDRVRELLGAVTGDKLIIDLRRTALGSAPAAYAVAGLLASGDLGRLRGRDAVLEAFEQREEPLWEGDLLVLVDRGTVGPAEVLAAVLRQASGARLVGGRSFGHAGRREAIPLSSGARLVLSTAFYTGPDGEPIAESLEPDVVVDDRSQPPRADGEEPVDRVLEEAVRLLGATASAEAA